MCARQRRTNELARTDSVKPRRLRRLYRPSSRLRTSRLPNSRIGFEQITGTEDLLRNFVQHLL